MTIVTTRPRKRPTKPAQAALIKVPRIVQHTPRGRAWKLPEPDPEAEVRAVASFVRQDDPAEVLTGRQSLTQPFHGIFEHYGDRRVGQTALASGPDQLVNSL